MNISVVIALLNEAESLPELRQWIEKVMLENNFTYEILFIDDGSNDGSWKIIEKFSEENQCIKAIKFRRNYGKSAALNSAFVAAQGDVIITMDADLQDSPDEIPELYRMIIEDGFDLVSGWKKKRHDPLSKTLPTKFYNGATRYVTGLDLHDMNCGLKAYKKEVIKTIEVYGEMHRYIPAIAKWSGFTKIGEKVVVHKARKYGKTKFGLERFINGFLDLMTIAFISKFGKRPMHLFGSIGTVLFALGFVIAGYLTVEKLFFLVFKMTERPLFYLSMLCMLMGTILFVGGFLAELISRNSSIRNIYNIEKTIGIDE
ncbi:MAG: glycosyltransferase [Bacteroidetes bacterium CG2_30_33_31]|nr:MAG: glycosyltransferase [Bacteroidetes bacterium CG2_30_33_31]